MNANLVGANLDNIFVIFHKLLDSLTSCTSELSEMWKDTPWKQAEFKSFFYISARNNV